VTVPPKHFARGRCKPSRAERHDSHGKRPRAQVEVACDKPSLSPSSSREAGGGPAMPSSRRFGGQRGKSKRVMAAVSALSNQNQLWPPPSQAEAKGWESRRICQRAPPEKPADRGPWEGHGRELPPAASGDGTVQPAGAAGQTNHKMIASMGNVVQTTLATLVGHSVASHVDGLQPSN